MLTTATVVLPYIQNNPESFGFRDSEVQNETGQTISDIIYVCKGQLEVICLLPEFHICAKCIFFIPCNSQILLICLK